MSDPVHYTFGDNDVASRRLRFLADAYTASTTAFLHRLAIEPAAQIVDLGCGPGYTTDLLGKAFAQAKVKGLDSSPRFIDQAERSREGRAEDRLSFAVHDITVTPFPAPPADLLYGRFILTHLAGPDAVVRTWADAAAPRARLALEETIAMESTDPLFLRYYGVVAAMQAALGQSLSIGADMPSIGLGTPWTVELSVVTPVELPARVAARLHSLNIQTWRHQPFVRDNVAASEIDEMAMGLVAVAEGTQSAVPVVCQMRQIVLRRS